MVYGSIFFRSFFGAKVFIAQEICGFFRTADFLQGTTPWYRTIELFP